MSPQLVPHWSFMVGQLPRPELATSLIALQITDVAGGRQHAAATFLNWGPSPDGAGVIYGDHTVLDIGRPFSIALGHATQPRTLFRGDVTSLEWHVTSAQPPTVTVLADHLPAFRTSAHTRDFSNVRLADVFATLAAENGLTFHIDVAGRVHRTVRQKAESDWAFIYREAVRGGADAWLHDDVVHVVDRRARSAVALTVQWGDGLTQFEGREVRDETGLSRYHTTASGLMRGNEVMHAGALMRVAGVGTLMDGDYLVTEVTHLYDESDGYRTAFAGTRREGREGTKELRAEG